MKNTGTPRAATRAQINANRRNAKKSSGPKSAEGKAASSRNGLKHGLCANQHILPGEDPEEFLLLLKDLHNTFRPVGLGEEKLVQRIAASQWLLDRVFPAAAGIYRERCQQVTRLDRQHQEHYEWEIEIGRKSPVPPGPHDQGDLLARAFLDDSDGPNSLAKLARYETSIERSIDRCLRQLKAFQAARTMGRALPPANGPEPPEAGPQSASNPPSTPSKTSDYEANPKPERDAQSCTTPHNPSPFTPAPSPSAPLAPRPPSTP